MFFERAEMAIARSQRELDLSNGSVRQWVKQAETDANPQAIGMMTTAERETISAMRKRLKHFEKENAFLRKAAASFAKETQ